MSFVNTKTKEINCKIVYYGPGLGGKTTNIQYIYSMVNADDKGELISLDTDNERTLFFDFLPLDLGTIRGHKVRFHLYSVPGQVFYEASRKLILRGMDGIIFVADSQLERMNENIESFEGLKKNLTELGYDIKKLPILLQWNKRDLPNVVGVDELKKLIHLEGSYEMEAIAHKGIGVFESLKLISKLVLGNLKRGMTKTDSPNKREAKNTEKEATI